MRKKKKIELGMLEIDSDVANKFSFCDENDIGVVCGMRREDKLIILEYIATPKEDEEENNNKSTKLNVDWISNHCENIQKMLPTGLEVEKIISNLIIFCSSKILFFFEQRWWDSSLILNPKRILKE